MFLYSITRLSEVMRGIFNENAKNAIAKYTSNLFSSIIIGILFTILLGSSSAVIILAIVFINAKTLTFRQAIGLIMGANIGTTFSSQFIALDVGQYSVYLCMAGLMMTFFDNYPQLKKWGRVLLYFGLLFFGLFVMESSVEPLRDSDLFMEWIAKVENNALQGALVGGFVTLIIQSSSGTVGMAIVLGNQGILNIAGGVAIMLGAELGTCSDTLIATIGGQRQAIKAGLFHLLFNLATIILGLIVFQPFVDLVLWLSPTTDIGTQIAHAHMLFNISGVIVFLPFARLMEKGLNALLPEKLAAND